MAARGGGASLPRHLLRQRSSIYSRTAVSARVDRDALPEGGENARRMRFSESVALGIHNLDEHWDGSGKPDGVHGPGIPVYARIALLPQIVDVFHEANGRETALRGVHQRSGGWFDPELVAAFL
jgi:response regulator RpfG family c-di-GMP phosphodiesterase